MDTETQTTERSGIATALNILYDELRPQINKLRLLRELFLDKEVSELAALDGEEETCIGDGLCYLLSDVIKAYDKVYDQIDKAHQQTRAGAEGRAILTTAI